MRVWAKAFGAEAPITRDVTAARKRARRICSGTSLFEQILDVTLLTAATCENHAVAVHYLEAVRDQFRETVMKARPRASAQTSSGLHETLYRADAQ